MALCSKWFSPGQTEEEKKQLELSLRRNRYSLDLLTEIIQKQIEQLRDLPEKEYANPGWALLAADRAGQIRALKDVLKLTKLEGAFDQ